MPGKTRPYEQFASYILFRKLESDALGDLWRAGRIEDRHLGPLVALRRLTGGNREALTECARDAREIAPLLTGSSFVKDQVIDVASGVPFLAHDYSGGRSLRHIIDRARGTGGVAPHPIPIDQAIAIAEKVALSLTTTGDLKRGGTRLTHGALIPQFIWISDDGEIRVAGQQLGKGLIASLKDSKVAAAIGRYFSPEYQQSAEPTKASEVYGMGAILFLLVTGQEPPDPTSVSAFTQAIRAAKTMAGQPVPDDIRAILDKSLVIDPARRFESTGDMKQALSALVHGGKYSATTFNLAFYLSSLLKKEMEGEAVDREKESKVNIVPYLEQRTLEVEAPPLPAFIAEKEQASARSKSGLYAAAVLVVIAAAAAGAFFLMRGRGAKPTALIAAPNPPASAPAKPPIVPQPIAATVPMTSAATATTATLDPAAQKKAFEDAVNQKLQEEMLKLQSKFNKDLQQKKSNSAPIPTATPVALTASVAAPKLPPVLDDRTPSAAALDERRLSTTRQETTTMSQTAAPLTQTQVSTQPPAQAQPEPAAPQPVAVHEGDVVGYNNLDTAPQLVNKPRVLYPSLAMKQRAQASVILTVFVSENGDVLDVKVLRGDPRFGFNDEAMRAMRGTKFRPGMKDGKRVKTWVPQPIDFKLQ
jgi:TonB family protein